MQNKSDAQLLREYAAQHSEPAFAEIVVRYTDLVYAAALRQTSSPELAREITQSVFTDLERAHEHQTEDDKPNRRANTGWIMDFLVSVEVPSHGLRGGAPWRKRSATPRR